MRNKIKLELMAATASVFLLLSGCGGEGGGSESIDPTAISFDTSESELTKKFPAVECKQMPNPKVRMCRLQASESESISYLYFSGKLININGRTRD